MVRPKNLNDKQLGGLRDIVARWVESDRFVNFIAAIIILNAILLGVETYPTVKHLYGPLLHIVDFLILVIFVIEISLKLFAYRLNFFREGWNIFDFIIVAGSLIPASGALTILRALRIFRILRLMSIVPSMRRVLSALFNAIPGMASIIGIMMIIFYIAAVVATKIFGASPDAQMQEFFGSLQTSMFTLFQIMTLENWPDIAAPTIALFPWAWIYFVLFIMVTTFAILNLFVGIIVDAMDIVHDFEEENKGVKDLLRAETEDLHRDIGVIHQEMAELKDLLKKR